MNLLHNDIFGSSVDNQKLSLTIKGLLLGVVPMLITVVRLTTNIDLPETLLNEIIDVVVSIVQQITVLASTVVICLGLFRKLLVLFKK